MNLLYFNSNNRKGYHNDLQFLEAFHTELFGWGILTFFSMDSLLETLKKPLINFEGIMLLHIPDEREVDKLLQQQTLLSKFDIIMILADTSKSYSDKCYRLHPRVVFWDAPEPMTLISVLKKKAQQLMQRDPAVLRAGCCQDLEKITNG